MSTDWSAEHRPVLARRSGRRGYNLGGGLGVVLHVTEELTVAAEIPRIGQPCVAERMTGGWASGVDDDDALAALYLRHFVALVRLAALLLDDLAASEDVAQEAYVRVALARHRLRDPDAALAYLRTTVVNLSRSAMRRRLVAARHGYAQSRPDVTPDATYDVVERDAMVRAVRSLPRRMREAVSLRYFADLSEAETAEVMGVSRGSVKSYTSRGLAMLAETMKVAS